jgi:hypothetical protein
MLRDAINAILNWILSLWASVTGYPHVPSV